MLQIPVFNQDGNPAGQVEIDPAILGGEVNPRLLKQAIVMYQANLRQNTSATKSRGMVEGSTRKLYRQKGTGNARAGTRRTNIRRGGGVAFAKGRQNFDQAMNKKMRRSARNNAILARIEGNNALVLESLSMQSPSTKRLAGLLRKVGAGDGCVVALNGEDRTAFLSGRNIPKTDVRPMAELNAYELLRRKKLVMTRSAFDAMVSDPACFRVRHEDRDSGE